MLEEATATSGAWQGVTTRKVLVQAELALRLARLGLAVVQVVWVPRLACLELGAVRVV